MIVLHSSARTYGHLVPQALGIDSQPPARVDTVDVADSVELRIAFVALRKNTFNDYQSLCQ